MIKDDTRRSIGKWIGETMFVRDFSEKGRVTQILFRIARTATYLGREFVTDLCPQKAAALAYTTVLSLVPVTALFVLYFKMAGKLDALSGRAQTWILDRFVADSAQDVALYIDQFVKNMHTKALGTLGAVGLLVSAYLLFRTIDRSLNEIWKVRMHRSFFARFQILCTILIVVPAFLIGSLYVSGKFQEVKVLGNVESLTALMRIAFLLAPFILTALPFFVIFKFIPNIRVQWRSALWAALFAGTLFEFAKAGFNFYVVNVINVSKIYGTLGLFPVLLIWIYFSWMIILLGVELSYVLQNFHTIHEEAKNKRIVGPLDVPLHEEWGVRIAVALALHFARGDGAIGKEVLSRDLGLKAIHVEDHLSVLAKAKLIASVDGEELSGYIYAKPLDLITTTEVANLFREELGLKPLKTGAGDSKLIDLAAPTVRA